MGLKNLRKHGVIAGKQRVNFERLRMGGEAAGARQETPGGIEMGAVLCFDMTTCATSRRRTRQLGAG